LRTLNAVCITPVESIRALQEAFKIVQDSESVRKKNRQSEYKTLKKKRQKAIDKAIAVDDFSPEELSAR
jgi:hypothetical protein